MTQKVHVGDKVIGLGSWHSKSYIGTVLLDDVSGFDPIHDLLINTSSENLTVQNVDDYKRRLAELSRVTELLSKKYTLPYSKRANRRLNRMLRFLSANRIGKNANYELEVGHFFERNGFARFLRVRTCTKAATAFFFRHFVNFILGTVELVLGDIWHFYSGRLRIKKLQQQLRKEILDLNRAKYFACFSRAETAEIEARHNENISKIEGKIEQTRLEKAETSRAFIAILIAVASLLLSIFLNK